MPHQASVDYSFREFAHTTGETVRTVAVSSFGPCPRRREPCQLLSGCEGRALVLQLLLKLPRSLDFALVPHCSHFSLVILSRPDFLSFEVFGASSNSFVLKGLFIYSGGSWFLWWFLISSCTCYFLSFGIILSFITSTAGLQQIFYCLTASTARELLCMAKTEFRVQVAAEAVVACPGPEHLLLAPVWLTGHRDQPCCTVLLSFMSLSPGPY